MYHPSDQFGARVAHKDMAGKPVKVEDKAPKEKMILQMEQMNPAGILWDVMCSNNMFLYNLMPQLKKQCAESNKNTKLHQILIGLPYTCPGHIIVAHAIAHTPWVSAAQP